MRDFLFIPRWPRSAAFAVALTAAAAGVILARGTGGSPQLRARAGTEAGEPLRPAGRPSAASPRDDANSESAWKRRWDELRGRVSSPARDRELAAWLAQLARTDPQRALELAAAESHWNLREDLRDAALRGWGATAPEAAAEWAMKLRLEDRFRGVAAVLAGAAEQPATAVPLALKLCAADSEPAGHYGHTLVSSLIEHGHFAAATKFARAATMVDTQTHIVDSAFYQWAQHRPEEALNALREAPAGPSRTSALQGVLEGWSAADPVALAQYAQKLPPGEDRNRAFGTVLPRWVEKDPTGATTWLNGIDPSPELDEGLAAVATLPALLAKQPLAAMDWADSISDPVKRRMTKHDVFYDWAQRDLAAATQHAAGVRNADEREMMDQVVALVRGRG